MWLEIIEPGGFRVARLSVPVDGEEWEHEIKHPVLIRPKTIRMVKDHERKDKPREKEEEHDTT